MGKGKRDNKDDKSTASLNKKLDDLNARFDRNLLELEKWKKNKKRIDRDIDRVKSDISKSKNELDEMVESKNNHEDIGNVLLMKNKKNSNKSNENLQQKVEASIGGIISQYFDVVIDKSKGRRIVDQHNDSDTGSDGSGVEIKSKSKEQTKAK